MLFDAYAATFDASLIDLEYHTPGLLAAAIAGHFSTTGAAGKHLRVLDLGAGTGV